MNSAKCSLTLGLSLFVSAKVVFVGTDIEAWAVGLGMLFCFVSAGEFAEYILDALFSKLK